MIVRDDIFVMLQVEICFKTLTHKEFSDAVKSTEAIIALSTDGHAKVDQMVVAALQTGGKTSREPQDEGWMYWRDFRIRMSTDEKSSTQTPAPSARDISSLLLL